MKRLSASILSIALVFTGAASPASAVSREKSGRTSDAARTTGGRTLIETLRQEDLSDSLVPTGLDAATELAAGADFAPLYMPNRAERPELLDAVAEIRLPGASRGVSPERRTGTRDARDARGDLAMLAATPAAASRAYDNAAAFGIRPDGPHPHPEIGHDPLPVLADFDRGFSLRIDPSKRGGKRLLTRNLNADVYPAWAGGPAGSVVLPGNPRDEASVEQAVRRFVADHPALLRGLQPDDFAIAVHKVEGRHGVPDMIYANLAQVHNNLLVEGSEIQFKVKLYGDQSVLLPVEAQLQPNLTLNTDGALGPDQINAAVRQRLGITPNDWLTTQREDLGRRIMRVGGQWRVLDVFMVRSKFTMAAVDVNTGESFAWDPRVNALAVAPAEATGTPGTVGGQGVKGHGPFTPTSEITELPLGYTEITTSAGVVVADADGKFVVPGEPGTTVSISATLKGKTYEIRDKSVQQQMTVTTTAPAGTKLKLVFPAQGADENRFAAAMLAYAINVTYDFAKRVLGKDIIGKTIGNANLNQTCNAHYEPWGENSINGYKASSQCVNSSYLSVMAHEMGHKIHDFARKKFARKVVTVQGTVEQKFTSLHVIDNHALSEGHGDTYANGITGDPKVGPGFIKGRERGEIRNAEDPPHRYSPNEEAHEGGKPWMEFAWELRKELIKLYGKEKGVPLYESLVYPVIFAAKDVPDAIDNVILRDLQADGTVPHFSIMAAIAAKRGITPKNPGKPAATLTAERFQSRLSELAQKDLQRRRTTVGEYFGSITGVLGLSMDERGLIVNFNTTGAYQRALAANKLYKKIGVVKVRYQVRGVDVSAEQA